MLNSIFALHSRHKDLSVSCVSSLVLLSLN